MEKYTNEYWQNLVDKGQVYWKERIVGTEEESAVAKLEESFSFWIEDLEENLSLGYIDCRCSFLMPEEFSFPRGLSDLLDWVRKKIIPRAAAMNLTTSCWSADYNDDGVMRVNFKLGPNIARLC